MTIQKLGGRKFLLSMFLLAIVFTLVMFGRLLAADFLKIALAVLALYTGVNFLTKTKDDIAPPSA